MEWPWLENKQTRPRPAAAKEITWKINAAVIIVVGKKLQQMKEGGEVESLEILPATQRQSRARLCLRCCLIRLLGTQAVACHGNRYRL